ncbi:MAG: UvrD-helicase domain-containing protein [Nitrospina sp.]|nr:UvrD-helicase domain-containing protein [Nitrospina sp.]
MALKNIGIEAGAGCGKTTRIVGDILEGLKKGEFSIDDIVVITFTRKAASELKSRISLKLQEAMDSGNPLIETQLMSMGNAHISTIHSFCGDLLKERPVEAGIDPGFTIIEDSEQEDFLNEVYDQWLREKLAVEQTVFRKLVLELEKELKTPENNFGRPDSSFLGIIKTSLQYRELKLFLPEKPEAPQEILKGFLNHCQPFLNSTDYDSVNDHVGDYVEAIQAAQEGNPEDYIETLSKFSLRNKGGRSCKEFRNEWKSICSTYVPRFTYAVRYPEIKDLYENTNRLVKDFVGCYRRAMGNRGIMDFNEILYQTEQLLHEDRAVREYFKKKFSYIFVDEFHDTDPLQARILFYLAEKRGTSADTWDKIQLEDGKIYVVGDPKQSIYRFRRADIEIYSEAMEKITTQGTGKQIFLSVNYRSSGKIIQWVNRFFQDRIKRPPDGNYQANYIPLKSHKDQEGGVLFVKPAGDISGIEDQKVEDARDMEAGLTASWIKANTDNGTFSYRDIMVLFRTKNNMMRTTEYLEELDIPYEMVGARSYFGRGEILDMANIMKAIANPLDQVSVLAALKGPFYSLTDRDLYNWRLLGETFDYRGAGENLDQKVGYALKEIRNLHQKSRQTTAADILREILVEKGILSSYTKTKHGRKKVLNILKAVELLRSLGRIPFVDAVADFADKLERNVEMPDFSPKTGEADEVQLLTIHKAKGLEQRVVYLADGTSANIRENVVFTDNITGKVIYNITKGFETPEYISWKEKDRDRNEAESERLRYVAATRAKEYLVINNVPFKGFEKTFIAPFFSEKSDTETVAIDIRSLTISNRKKIEVPNPKALAGFDQELNRIQVDVPETIQGASVPSLTVKQPSAGELDFETQEISIQVIYDDSEMDFRVERASAATIGSLAHKLMEIDPSDLRTAAETLLKNEKSDVDPFQLVSIVNALQKEPLRKRLSRAKTILREVPIKFKASNNLYYDGNIDLLFEENDGWVLVDYKTVTVSDKDAEEKVRKKYQAQMTVYAEGLKQLGLKVKDILIVSC